MDAVLALFDDKVYDATTRQRGYTQPEQISPDQLPLVQAYVPVTASDTSDDGQQTDTLAFVLSLFDVQGTADAMRPALSALSLALDRDPTLGGLARRALVTGYSIGELGAEEMTRADATIEVVYFTDGIYNNVGGDVELLPLGGFGNFIGSKLPDIVQDSARFPNSVEMNINQASSTLSEMIFGDDSVSYDITTVILPLKLTRFMRVSFYLFPECDPDAPVANSDPRLTEFIVRLDKSSGPNVRNTYTLLGITPGWNHKVVDLDNPTGTTGGGFDTAVDTPLSVYIRWRKHNAAAVTNNYSIVLGKVFYRPSDLR